MKLWIKLTCIALISTMTAFSVCLYAFSAWQSERILTNAEKQACELFDIFCTNLESIDNTMQGYDVNELTSRSVVQYYFATYAHLLSNETYYSLVQDGEYLYNVGSCDPITLIDIPENANQVMGTFDTSGYFIIVAKQIHLLYHDYEVYLCMDVTSEYEQVGDIACMSAIMLVLSAAIVLIMTAALVRRALKPVENLRQTAESIASGEYSLRVQVESEDEVAVLAQSFNHMADAVETRIDAITEESERRRLLLGAMAHELKTPMTAVIGFSESLLKMPLKEEQKLHCAEQILMAGKRTERISQKLMLLLSLGNGEKIEKTQFDLVHFAEELGGMYDERVQITANGRMTGDRDLLFSLTQNLINNAVNASPPDGIIKVTLNEGQIIVSDCGRGIPPEHIARLTEPFYRVDKARSRRHGGAGLGLSLCKAIADAHDGTMIIDSIPDVGTTVTVTIMGEVSCNENNKEEK